MDCLATEATEDFSWDAIWESKATITNFGWVVEMKFLMLPYALAMHQNKLGIELLCAKRDVTFKKYTWNHVNTKIAVDYSSRKTRRHRKH
jgi:hypothetical protein